MKRRILFNTKILLYINFHLQENVIYSGALSIINPLSIMTEGVGPDQAPHYVTV